MDDPGKGAAFPSLPELRGGYCPCPGRHSERKRPSTPANMSDGPGRTDQKKSSCFGPDPRGARPCSLAAVKQRQLTPQHVDA
jgi:hypothetical protein